MLPGFSFFSANWILKISETGKHVSDCQIVRTEIPLSCKISANAVQIEVRMKIN